MTAAIRTSLAAISLAAVAALIGAGSATTQDKVLVCHGTASEVRQYVMLEVDASGLNGHLDGTGPGHGWQNYPDFVDMDGDGNCYTQGGGGGE